MGWNGMNMFTPLKIGNGFNLTSGAITDGSTSAITDYIPVDFSQNEAYIMKVSKNYRSMVAAYNENKEFLGRVAGNARSSITLRSDSFTTDPTENEGPVKYVIVRMYTYSGLSGVISEVNDFPYQMQPGTETTNPYETFYILSDTNVIQQTNHTLKAIWQENN